jgi:hypothetical protein
VKKFSAHVEFSLTIGAASRLVKATTEW